MIRADEALPFAAIAGRSAIGYADCDLTLTDGIGALLRHRPFQATDARSAQTPIGEQALEGSR